MIKEKTTLTSGFWLHVLSVRLKFPKSIRTTYTKLYRQCFCQYVKISNISWNIFISAVESLQSLINMFPLQIWPLKMSGAILCNHAPCSRKRFVVPFPRHLTIETFVIKIDPNQRSRDHRINTLFYCAIMPSIVYHW